MFYQHYFITLSIIITATSQPVLPISKVYIYAHILYNWK